MGLMVCGLLLASVLPSDAAQNSKDATASPSGQKGKEGNNQKDVANGTTPKPSDPKSPPPSLEAEQSPSPVDSSSRAPKPEKSSAGSDKKSDSEKSSPRLDKKSDSEKSRKPVETRSPKPGHTEDRSSKGEAKKNKVKSTEKEVKVKAEKSPKAEEVRPKKVLPTASSEPAISVDVSTPTPSPIVSSSPHPTSLTAEIEKANGNKATLVVSGVKEGTKVTVIITKKDSKK